MRRTGTTAVWMRAIICRTDTGDVKGNREHLKIGHRTNRHHKDARYHLQVPQQPAVGQAARASLCRHVVPGFMQFDCVFCRLCGSQQAAGLTRVKGCSLRARQGRTGSPSSAAERS